MLDAWEFLDLILFVLGRQDVNCLPTGRNIERMVDLRQGQEEWLCRARDVSQYREQGKAVKLTLQRFKVVFLQEGWMRKSSSCAGVFRQLVADIGRTEAIPGTE